MVFHLHGEKAGKTWCGRRSRASVMDKDAEPGTAECKTCRKLHDKDVKVFTEVADLLCEKLGPTWWVDL